MNINIFTTDDNKHQWVTWYPKDNPEPWYVFTTSSMRSFRFPWL